MRITLIVSIINYSCSMDSKENYSHIFRYAKLFCVTWTAKRMTLKTAMLIIPCSMDGKENNSQDSYAYYSLLHGRQKE